MPRVKKKRHRYHQVIDGEWFEPTLRDWSLQCCDCARVHRVDFRRRENGGIEIRMRLDNRATASARRHFRFSKVDHDD